MFLVRCAVCLVGLGTEGGMTIVGPNITQHSIVLAVEVLCKA